MRRYWIPCAGTREAPCSKRNGWAVAANWNVRKAAKKVGAGVVAFGAEKNDLTLVCAVCIRFYEAEVEAQERAVAVPTAERGYQCPKPADGPRTIKKYLGTVLSFAPGNDACTWCDHCGESLEAHGPPPSAQP